MKSDKLFTHFLSNVRIFSNMLNFRGDGSTSGEMDSSKRSQHNHLVSHLISSGWTLATSISSPHIPRHMDPLDLALDALPLQLPANVPDLSRYVHIILLSSSGVIFKPTDSILSILGISTPDIDKLLRSLPIHSQ